MASEETTLACSSASTTTTTCNSKKVSLGQSERSDSPFEVTDHSIKEPDPQWRPMARERIAQCGVVIVMCGHHTDTATGVQAEIEFARQLGKPYFLLRGYRKGTCVKPRGAKSTDEIHPWTWNTLVRLLNGGTIEPTEWRCGRPSFRPAENTSIRREAINRYMVPVHLAIFAAHLVRDFPEPVHVYISTAGVAIGALWAILLHSHNQINKVKYDIILSLEEELPCRPFTDEARLSGIEADRRRTYIGLSTVQIWGAGVVIAVHVVMLIYFLLPW